MRICVGVRERESASELKRKERERKRARTVERVSEQGSKRERTGDIFA